MNFMQCHSYIDLNCSEIPSVAATNLPSGLKDLLYYYRAILYSSFIYRSVVILRDDRCIGSQYTQPFESLYTYVLSNIAMLNRM